QTENTFDADGNITETILRRRFHDETGTGALGTPTTGVKARVSYEGFYRDKANRLTATVDVGTNDGSASTMPPSVPARSDGVTVAGGSGIDSNDVLASVDHPDKSTGSASSSERDLYKVDALGEVISAQDRNGSVHNYTLDVLGRMTVDAIATLGSGVDGAV